MAKVSALSELRSKELMTLRGRVERRIKFKPGPKRIRRIAGVDIVLTPQASKVHVCACLMSFPKMQVIEEAIATDELEAAFDQIEGVYCCEFSISLKTSSLAEYFIDASNNKEIKVGIEIAGLSEVGDITSGHLAKGEEAGGEIVWGGGMA